MMQTTRSSLRESQRSSSSGGTSSAKSPCLRGNLTRQHSGRDPLAFYDLQQLLGTGSMGTVATVRKKQHTVGLSARYDLKKRERAKEKINACFSIPILGGLFSFLFKAKADAMLEEASLAKKDDATADDDNTSTAEFSSSMVYAMKSIHLKLVKDPSFVEELKNEIEVLKTLDHPHIIKIFETFKYNNQIFVIMELCSGGDLYTRDPYTEDQAARITSSILTAVSYMHSKGVLHRDLKYENILFVDESPNAPIKLIDFGLSKQIMEHENVTEIGGTVYTMAPEVLQNSYHKQADLWSVGVIAYMLMSSQMPFYGRTRKDVIKKILSGKYDFKGRRWKRVSNQGKAFVQDLLVMDPKDRLTADQASSALWLHHRHTATVREPHSGELENVKRSIKRYVTYPRLRKLSLMVIAHRSTHEEIGILRKVFQHYDTDRKGTLSYEEFKIVLNEAGFLEENYKEIFDAVNMDGSGLIRYTEFLAATMEAVGWISEERLAEAFDRVDHDNTGYITKENLRYLFGSGFPEEEIDAIMKEAASKDGMGISYADFLAQWNDDKDEFERQWRRHMFQDVVVEDRNNISDDAISELSFSEDSDSGTPARVNFIEGKSLSIRKKLDLASERKSYNELRKVVLQEQTDTTPLEEDEQEE